MMDELEDRLDDPLDGADESLAGDDDFDGDSDDEESGDEEPTE